MQTYFRHERVRKHQDELIKDIADCIENKRHLVACAPAGIGKTDSSLSAALSYSIENGNTVFFLTPKISQHEMAVNVLSGLKKKYPEISFRAVDIIGKRHMCADPLLRELESSDPAGPEDFYELCKRKKQAETCKHYSKARGYDLKGKASASLRQKEILKWFGAVRGHKEMLEFCNDSGLCPYETALSVAAKSQVIIADYYHVLNPTVSKTFLSRANKALEDSILIIDEAHNLPERIRKSMTVSLDTFTLRRCQAESKVVGDRLVEASMRKVERDVIKLGESRLNGKNESVVAKEELPVLDAAMLEELHKTGVSYLEATNRAKSACLRVKRFFEQWSQDSDAYLRMVRRWRSGFGFTVTRKCLDPSVVAGPMLNAARSAILMSGTLKPQEMYADLLGLDQNRTELKEYLSPFPKENRLSIIVPSVTTKYTKRGAEEYGKIADGAANVANSVPGNAAVFFPSYGVLHAVLPLFREKVVKPVLFQKENASPQEVANLLSSFRSHAKTGGAVLAGVQGGSLSEGIDYPGNELLAVIVVGVPLAEPDLETHALIDYYEGKFGKGWSYGYLYPAVSKSMQAAGRCIRNESDRGAVVFMDNRFTWKNYSRCFPMDMDVRISETPEKLVRSFWGL